MNEISFLVEDAAEGGYTALSLGDLSLPKAMTLTVCGLISAMQSIVILRRMKSQR